MRLSARRCGAAAGATLACCAAAALLARAVIADMRASETWRPPLQPLRHDKSLIIDRLLRTQPAMRAARCRFVRRFGRASRTATDARILFIGDSTLQRPFDALCHALSDRVMLRRTKRSAPWTRARRRARKVSDAAFGVAVRDGRWRRRAGGARRCTRSRGSSGRATCAPCLTQWRERSAKRPRGSCRLPRRFTSSSSTNLLDRHGGTRRHARWARRLPPIKCRT